ncbi:MAG: hypothetical protein ACYTG2_09870 [Planctomycetota bacterium]
MDRGTPALRGLLRRRPREGQLFGLFERHALSDTDVALLLALLAGRMAGRATETGGALARSAANDSAGRLAALTRLTTDGPLVAGGLLVPDGTPSDGVEAETTPFRLGEHVMRVACDLFVEVRAARPLREAPTPYADNAALLAGLRRLSLVYRRRAASIFHLDPWTGTGLLPAEGAHESIERAREEAKFVEQRLALTTSTEGLPLLAIMREHALDLDALVILVTVLFQEVVEGVGAVDAVDLVKLVCTSEEELLRRRMLLRPLERRRLIRLEGAYAGKELTADISLPNAVVDRLLGSTGRIGSDERIDFHAWLQQLDSSDPFFGESGGGEDA